MSFGVFCHFAGEVGGDMSGYCGVLFVKTIGKVFGRGYISTFEFYRLVTFVLRLTV